MKIYEHMEAHLGHITRGWGPPSGNAFGIEVSLFENIPEVGMNTFSTLGLSNHILAIGNKQVRQELLFGVSNTYPIDDVASFLITFAEGIAVGGRGLLRGEVIAEKPLIQDVMTTGVYASIPVLWPEELHVFEGSSPKTVFVWLLPICRAEIEVITAKGWNYFEDYLEDVEVDFWDLNRPSLF
ncbi:suppressor of fused domain protein [Hymenobacter caeli]|uniref:Suppressor of fused-like domain-containing protein n=1 Tax=Hymenobacter caeli TaxID=2735894 RepID=A0ABX2FN51_9BACT|nr:suppressor of fused domain protein [Hymenobacter caeli]NRT18273.1 hypothetical protein [Hymenobacter caeli]